MIIIIKEICRDWQLPGGNLRQGLHHTERFQECGGSPHPQTPDGQMKVIMTSTRAGLGGPFKNIFVAL